MKYIKIKIKLKRLVTMISLQLASSASWLGARGPHPPILEDVPAGTTIMAGTKHNFLHPLSPCANRKLSSCPQSLQYSNQGINKIQTVPVMHSDDKPLDLCHHNIFHQSEGLSGFLLGPELPL